VQDREVVLVPSGVLHGMPISLLPTLRGRPTSVAPSATVWARAAGDRARRHGRDGRSLAAGPGLAAAGRGGGRSRRPPSARRPAHRSDATVAAVAAAADGAQWVHLAAHGRLRTDNPLFSSLESRRRAADRSTTWSAWSERRGWWCCPRAISGRRVRARGEETLGLTSALLALGSRTLVASIMPVPDDAGRWLMLALHEAHGAGLPAGRCPGRGASSDRRRPDARWQLPPASSVSGRG
jgi:hypothetical protein